MEGSETRSASQLIDHIEGVALRVTDVERALEFYRGVAGLQVVEKRDHYAALGAGLGSPMVTLSSDGVTDRPLRAATGLYHTAFLYPDRQALGEALARIVKAGYQVGASDHWVSEALYVDDPDGNGVELYRDRPRDQWPEPSPGSPNRIGMGLDPLDLRALLAEALAHGPVGNQAPAGTRIGHVHFQVSDVAETIYFYSQVLGLDLMAGMADQAAFFSSGGYHHHIAGNVWHSRDQGPAGREHAGLDHVDFTTDPQELASLQRRLEEQGHPYSMQGETLVVADPSLIELRFIPAA